MKLYLKVLGSDHFFNLLAQLKDQAVIYTERKSQGNAPGNYTYIGETMNIYCSLDVAEECNCSIGKIWLLVKPIIDG
jgi:hypothetical protein